MCGILFSTISQLSDQDFSRALARMMYRGPNASGIFRHQDILMGHLRLAILDLDARANQPFFSEDKRYAIIFNGEIYNYRELAQKYRLSLVTASDTEVLLALYQLKGAEILNELNGMFAFVILDCATGEWFAARDRLGVKPLYLTHYQGGLILSSEPAPILQMIPSPGFDPIAVRQYRKLRTFFNNRTIWQGISQFPAGHYMKSDGKLKRWWSFSQDQESPPGDEELRALITDAVKIRQIADVPVGAYLSGGLDSSIVAGLMHKPDTWAVGMLEQNEFKWAELAAKKFKSNHHQVSVSIDDFLSIAEEMIAIRCEPLSVPNEVLIYLMTSQVSKKNTVVLSGEGADELFFGYDRIFRWADTNVWDLHQFSDLYAYGSHDDLEIVEDAIQPFLNQGSALDIVAAFFQIAHLHGLLRRLDSATMLCSVEARTPFVDYRLVERLAGVSFDWRMEKGEVKAPLKRIFHDILPSEIIRRKKVGFPVPLSNLPFNRREGLSDMDCWFEFNLSRLAKTRLKLEEVV